MLGKDADTIIATTALAHNLTLVTTNVNHFLVRDLIVYQAEVNFVGMIVDSFQQKIAFDVNPLRSE